VQGEGRDVIEAHLLGNIWAQEWGNIYKPESAFDLTAILEARAEIDAAGMVHIGEQFFTSLGFAPLPSSLDNSSLGTSCGN